MPLPVASAEWPDAFDLTTVVAFFVLVVGLPALGYFFMVVDYLAWLRALRGALVKVSYYFPQMPAWARYETPGCIRALGLTMPCTEVDVKRAYRRLAEKLHPDRGGDARRFLVIQEHFEEALAHVRKRDLV